MNRQCSADKNKSKCNCNCTYEPCPRKGICCECISYHWFSGRELPACFFSPGAERTYDRSLDNFLKDCKKR
ncbi:MAG: DUF6485 family protein [Elusimicrobiota bacterium]